MLDFVNYHIRFIYTWIHTQGRSPHPADCSQGVTRFLWWSRESNVIWNNIAKQLTNYLIANILPYRKGTQKKLTSLVKWPTLYKEFRYFSSQKKRSLDICMQPLYHLPTFCSKCPPTRLFFSRIHSWPFQYRIAYISPGLLGIRSSQDLLLLPVLQ
jgi:hypothetical protein